MWTYHCQNLFLNRVQQLKNPCCLTFVYACCLRITQFIVEQRQALESSGNSAYSQQRKTTVPHVGSHLGLCAEADRRTQGKRAAAPHILADKGVVAPLRQGGPWEWALVRASLGVSPPWMDESRRYYVVSSLIGRPGEDILQKNDDLSRLCTQSARSRKKKITHGPRTRVLWLAKLTNSYWGRLR